MLRYPNPEQPRCFLYAGSHLMKNHKCEVHECGSKKGKTYTHTIAKCCNCYSKNFALARVCPKCQRAIETAKTGRAEWWEKNRVAQQAQIDVEIKDEAGVAAAEAEFAPEPTDLILQFDATVIELSVDYEDTDEQMDGTVPEHWEDADLEAALCGFYSITTTERTQ